MGKVNTRFSRSSPRASALAAGPVGADLWLLAGRIGLLWLLVSCWLIGTGSAARAGELRSSDLVRYLRDVVQMHYQVPAQDIVVIWKDGEPGAKLGVLPDGESVTYRVRDEVQSSLLGREAVPFSFYSQNRLLRTVFFKVHVDAFKRVAMTSGRIGLHDPLTARNTRLERLSLSRVPAGAFPSLQSLAGSHARRALSPNTILTDALVDAPPTVRRGGPVSLQVVNGGLLITAEGIALSDGYVGQTVKVQNTVNGQTVYATVVNSRQVRITMEGENNEE